MSSSSCSSSSSARVGESALSLNSLYAYDTEKIDAMANEKKWMGENMYFKSVKISPAAAMKMQMHGQAGVDKGIKRNGKPVEVMGLLLGRPDTTDPRSFIIVDAQALPIEGFETSVVADNDEVINYMIELGEVNEKTRPEKFCGWYHTHPFDLDTNSHCYLSSTDVTTQLQWQRHSDSQGDPWFAIVIDPLRSLAKSVPEMMCFRAHDPTYSPPLNMTPDGTIVADEKSRLEKWGVCWNRYYKLEIGYYMSTLAQNTLGILKNNALWMQSFTATPLQAPDKQQRIRERVGKISERLKQFESSVMTSGVGLSTRASSASSLARESTPMSMGKTASNAEELAVEHCEGCVCQMAKNLLFGLHEAQARRARAKAAAVGVSSSTLSIASGQTAVMDV